MSGCGDVPPEVDTYTLVEATREGYEVGTYVNEATGEIIIPDLLPSGHAFSDDLLTLFVDWTSAPRQESLIMGRHFSIHIYDYDTRVFTDEYLTARERDVIEDKRRYEISRRELAFVYECGVRVAVALELQN
jgi:hypothetical protein